MEFLEYNGLRPGNCPSERSPQLLLFIEGLSLTKMCSNYIMKTVYTSKTNDNKLN